MKPRSLIFDTTVRMVFDAALVLSVYFLFAGHNQPGGGFIGGLVAAAAIALRYISGGLDEVLRTVVVRPWMLPAVGLALAAGTAVASLLVGGPPLDQGAAEWVVPGLGTVTVTTAVVFDGGVYLIVVGLVVMVLDGLGDDEADELEEAET